MGGTAHKRLVRKRDLERALSEIEAHPSPNAYFEQYTTPSNVAAEALYIAAYVYDDIVEKTVLELGCGTGRLAIGAALLGAKEVFGVDVDGVAVSVAQKNAEIISVKDKTNWVIADIDVVKGNFNTVLQNPPFGVQRRRADRPFISKSLELSSTIYSFHKGGESNREFIKRFIEGHGGRVTNIFPLKMEIPRMFKFHTKKKKITQVDLYRIEGKIHDRI
jgi:putative methylase